MDDDDDDFIPLLVCLFGDTIILAKTDRPGTNLIYVRLY